MDKITSVSPANVPGSGRARYHAKFAVAVVDTRWRHEGGGAVGQFQRGEDPRATGAGSGSGVVVDEALWIKFAKPLQGKPWPGAVEQQVFASGVVGGLNAHRAIDGEASGCRSG